MLTKKGLETDSQRKAILVCISTVSLLKQYNTADC